MTHNNNGAASDQVPQPSRTPEIHESLEASEPSEIFRGLELLQKQILYASSNRKSSRLLLILIYALFLGLAPGTGIVISPIFRNTPIWYWIIFWTIEIFLFLFSLFIEGRKVLTRREAPEKTGKRKQRLQFPGKWKKFFILCSVAYLAIFTWGVLSSQNLQEDTVIKCGDQEDCFSWGEDILVNQSPAFVGEEVWKEECRENWQSKQQGTIAYKAEDFKSAKAHFELFTNKSVCPNDPEARIYLNNAIAELDQKHAFRIVVSLPISRNDSKGSFNALQVLRGIALAQTRINNEEGIRGRKLIVGIADDGFKDEGGEDEAAAASASFIGSLNNVVGVIGHDSSDATEAAAKIYHSLKLVAISPTSTAIRKSDDNDNGIVDLGDYVFRTALSDYQNAELLAHEMSKQYQRVAIIHDGDSGYSRSFMRVFEKIFVQGEQGSIVNNPNPDRCDISKRAGYQSDPSKCLQQALEGDAQALLLIPDSKTIELIPKLIELNSTRPSPLPLLGSDSVYDQLFLEKEKEARGLTIPITWHRSSNPSSFEDYSQNYFAFEGAGGSISFKIDWTTATAFDATQTLAEGLRKVSRKCSFRALRFWSRYAATTCLRERLRDALLEPDFSAEGALGRDSIKFDAQGDRLKTEGLGVLVKVCRDEKSDKFEFHRVEECAI